MANISWHIEPTSKCLLECPLCDRTWFYKKFKKRLTHEIDIKQLIKFFNGHSPIVTMCGNNGDPIYHSKFHNLCTELKKINCTIKIITNGSGKKKEWWTSLCKILHKQDSIIFSIDGLEDTNHIYRQNAKWNTIIDAISVVTKFPIDTTWKFIVFKHNQHQIEEAKKYSKKLGIKNFRLEKSDRWLEEQSEKFKPSVDFVDSYHEHQRKVLNTPEHDIRMTPFCLKNDTPSNELYIDSEGNFYPCCWIGTYRYKFKSIFSPQKLNFNIKKHCINDIMEHDEVKMFFQSTKHYEFASECCKLQCGVKNG